MRISIILEALTGRFETDMARASRQARNRAREIERSFERMGRLATRAFAALGVGISVRAMTELLDRATRLTNQLRLVTTSSEELSRVQSRLFEIAQGARASVEGTVSLYSRMAQATSELGISQERLFRVTEAISHAIAVSGVSAEEADRALTQLAQGMAAGVLRGQDLNSVMSQTPRLAQAIAAGLGVTIGQLRELGSEGKLTAEAIIGALESQARVLKTEYESTAVTVGDALTRLGNSMLGLISRIDEATGSSSFLAKELENVSEAIDRLGDTGTDARVRNLRDELERLERFVAQFDPTPGPIERLFAASPPEQVLERIRELKRELRELTVLADLKPFPALSLAGGGRPLVEPIELQVERITPRFRAEDFKLSEAEKRWLDDWEAELVVSIQRAEQEAAEAARRMAEETRLFIDDEIAKLNVPRLSPGQDLSPELTVFIDQLREAEELTRSVMTDAELAAERIARAEMLFGEGLISEETLNRVRESLDRMEQDFDRLGVSLGRGLRDSLVDAMTGIEVRWDDMLRRMIANAALDQLFNLLGTLGGPVGGVARFLGFGGARAAGGPVYPGRAYLVGERGPEIITPKAMGTVIPNHALGGTTIHVDARGSTDPAAVEVAVQRAVREAVQISGAQTQAMIGRLFRPAMA